MDIDKTKWKGGNETVRDLVENAPDRITPDMVQMMLDGNAQSFRQKAEQGDPLFQCMLGICFQQGKGTPHEETEATKWFRKAAEQGNSAAQYNLGKRLYDGRGVEQNLQEASKWFRKVAEQGSANGQLNLGLCYYCGVGLEKNENEAAKWFRMAAEQGNAKAQRNLGICFVEGRGVEQDQKEAFEWFRQSAGQGDADAQFSLGLSYHLGRGVQKDESEAIKWFRMAAEQGNTKAQSNLEAILQNTHFPKPMGILFLTSQDHTNDGIRESIEFVCKKYSLNPQVVFSGELSVQTVAFIDRETMRCNTTSFLSQSNLEEFGKHFSDQLRGGGRIILRCLITDDVGNGRHEIGIVWSKRYASEVQKSIRDCEPWEPLI